MACLYSSLSGRRAEGTEGKQAEKEQCCYHSMQEELCGFIARILCVFCSIMYYTDTYDV